MKRFGILLVAVLFVLLTTALVAGARPDDGVDGNAGRAQARTVEVDVGEVLDCLTERLGRPLTQDEFKELRVEMAYPSGRVGQAESMALAFCAYPGQTAAP